jgi:hypothetical protein
MPQPQLHHAPPLSSAADIAPSSGVRVGMAPANDVEPRSAHIASATSTPPARRTRVGHAHVESRRRRNTTVWFLLGSCPWIVASLLVTHGVRSAWIALAAHIVVLVLIHQSWSSPADP